MKHIGNKVKGTKGSLGSLIGFGVGLSVTIGSFIFDYKLIDDLIRFSGAVTMGFNYRSFVAYISNHLRKYKDKKQADSAR